MKLRDTLAAATAAVLIAGCGTESQPDKGQGCGRYVSPGPISVESLAKTILQCRQNLLETKQQSADEHGLTAEIEIQTKDGGHVRFTVDSEAPENASVDERAKRANLAMLTVFAPNVNDKVAAALTMGKHPQGGIFTYWDRTDPKLEIWAGVHNLNGVPELRFVPEKAIELKDPTDPEVIECVNTRIKEQFAHILGTVSTQSSLPQFNSPLLPMCSGG